MLTAFRKHYPAVRISLQHLAVGWMVRHAAWLYTKLKLGKDGKTAHVWIFGKPYAGAVLEFGEQAKLKVIGKRREFLTRWIEA